MSLPKDYETLAPDFIGRRLNINFEAEDAYRRALRRLRHDETLFFVHDQGTKKVPIQISSQAEYDENFGRYSAGKSLRFILAADPAQQSATLIFQDDDGPGPIIISSLRLPPRD